MWEKYGSINLLDAQVRLFECCFEAHGHWNDCGYIRNLFMWAVRGAAMRHVSDIVCKRLLGKAFTTAHLIFTTARKLYNRLQTPRTVCRLCCYDAYAASVHFSIYYFLFFLSYFFFVLQISYLVFFGSSRSVDCVWTPIGVGRVTLTLYVVGLFWNFIMAAFGAFAPHVSKWLTENAISRILRRRSWLRQVG